MTPWHTAVWFAAVLAACNAPPSAQVTVPTLTPRPEDVGSIDGIVAAFYDVISGPAGAPRQWGRDRTLHIPGVQFVSLSMVGDRRPRAAIMSHQQFVDATDSVFVRAGFYEREIHRVTRSFGNIAHVFSTYESRRTPDGPVTDRGINSIQLFWDGTRWWIASAIWDEERSDNPIPREHLP
jgi:hypothetical protein